MQQDRTERQNPGKLRLSSMRKQAQKLFMWFMYKDQGAPMMPIATGKHQVAKGQTPAHHTLWNCCCVTPCPHCTLSRITAMWYPFLAPQFQPWLNLLTALLATCPAGKGNCPHCPMLVAPVSAVEEKIRIFLCLSQCRKIAEPLRAAVFKPSDLNRAMHPVTKL